MQHPSLYIAASGEKGRGVYTSEPIPEGTVIEEAPVIVMSQQDRRHLDKTLLHDYIFAWEPEGQDLCCMALGWIPIYNHSYTSNCEYFMVYDDEIIYLKTMRDIAAGEELTINYNGEWNNESPVWFEVKS